MVLVGDPGGKYQKLYYDVIRDDALSALLQEVTLLMWSSHLFLKCFIMKKIPNIHRVNRIIQYRNTHTHPYLISAINILSICFICSYR